MMIGNRKYEYMVDLDIICLYYVDFYKLEIIKLLIRCYRIV